MREGVRLGMGVGCLVDGTVGGYDGALVGDFEGISGGATVGGGAEGMDDGDLEGAVVGGNEGWLVGEKRKEIMWVYGRVRVKAMQTACSLELWYWETKSDWLKDELRAGELLSGQEVLAEVALGH
eukprot:gene5180-6602_t